MSEITFNDLPDVVSTLVDEIKSLRQMIDSRLSSTQPEQQTTWMTMAEFREFHPEHPAPTTVYGWVRNGLIPHYKKGKKLFFKRSEIEAWLNDGRQKTDAEYEAEATDYMNRRRTGK